MWAVTGRQFWDAFFVGLAVAVAAAIVSGVVSLVRFIRRTDAQRITALEEARLTAKRVEHRQGHVIRWARAVGRAVGIPFPLDDGDDDPNHWHDEQDWTDP